MKLSHDVLLALADVARIADPDLLRQRFADFLNGVDDRITLEFVDFEPKAETGSIQIPIVTPRSSFGYAVLRTCPPDWDDRARSVLQAAFDLLAVLLENRKLTDRLGSGHEPSRGEGKKTNTVLESHGVDADRRFEEQLAHSRDLMLDIIEHSNSAVAVFDRNLHYVYVSQRYIDDYRLDRNIVGRHHYDVFPELPEKWKDIHRKTLQGQVNRADCDPFVRKDGALDWIRWECRPWFDENKEIGGMVLYTENITERVEAEERTRNSEARFRLLAESAPVGILILDGQEKVIYTSSRFTEIFGYTMEDIPSVDAWWPLAYPDETLRKEVFDSWVVSVDRARQTGREVEPVVYPVTCRNGEIRHIEFRMTLAGDLNVVIFIDVSARTLMEMELKQTNQTLTQLLDVADQLTLALTPSDLAGIIKHAARQLIGADGVSIIFREGDQCHYVDEDAVSPLWKGQKFPMDGCVSGWAMHHRQPVTIENIEQDQRVPLNLYRHSFVKSLALSPIGQNDPIGAIGVYWAERHVITEAELALLNALCNMTGSVWNAIEKSRSLRERDELQKAIVESSPLPLFSIDLKGNVLSWNSSAETVFGWTADEVTGKPLPVVPEENQAEFERLLVRVRREGGFTGLEIENQRRNGQRMFASLSTAPIYGEQQNVIGIMATIEDITLRKQAEEELRTLKDHLEKEVAEKTRELQGRIAELERFYDATVEREFRIKELRDEIDRMKGGCP